MCSQAVDPVRRASWNIEMCSILTDLGDYDSARMRGLLALHCMGLPLPTSRILSTKPHPLMRLVKPLKRLRPACLDPSQVTYICHAHLQCWLRHQLADQCSVQVSLIKSLKVHARILYAHDYIIDWDNDEWSKIFNNIKHGWLQCLQIAKQLLYARCSWVLQENSF